MVSAHQFLMNFLKELVAHADNRPAILEEYTKAMEARERSLLVGTGVKQLIFGLMDESKTKADLRRKIATL